MKLILNEVCYSKESQYMVCIDDTGKYYLSFLVPTMAA